jgi:hypothetical protein
MTNGSWGSDKKWERDREKEPTCTGRPRPIIALDPFGTLRTHYVGIGSINRCSVCTKPCAANRCEQCQAIDARRVECECCWLGAGQVCPGHEVAA